MASENAEHEHDHDHGHHDHTMLYVKVWAALLVLLMISVLGPELGIPTVTLITAFGIAVIKAGMVIKYFMHVDTELKMVWYILSGAVVLMFLFFFGTAADVMNHEGSRWENVAAKHEVERALAAEAAGGGHHGEHGDAGHGDEGSHGGDEGHKEDAGGHH